MTSKPYRKTTSRKVGGSGLRERYAEASFTRKSSKKRLYQSHVTILTSERLSWRSSWRRWERILRTIKTIPVRRRKSGQSSTWHCSWPSNKKCIRKTYKTREISDTASTQSLTKSIGSWKPNSGFISSSSWSHSCGNYSFWKEQTSSESAMSAASSPKCSSCCLTFRRSSFLAFQPTWAGIKTRLTYCPMLWPFCTTHWEYSIQLYKPFLTWKARTCSIMIYTD